MKKSLKEGFRTFFGKCLLYLLALSIPVLLAIDGIQSRRYAELEREVKQLDDKQLALIEDNKRLITGISVLSSSERIESLAVNELAMHRATSEEIVRVEVKGD